MIHSPNEAVIIGLKALGVEVDERGAKKRATHFMVKTPKLSVVKICFVLFSLSRTILENSFLENSPCISCPSGGQIPLEKGDG